MKYKYLETFTLLYFFLFTFLISCGSSNTPPEISGIGRKQPGCKGTFYLDPEDFKINDSITKSLTKGLGFLDIAVNNLLNVSQDKSNTSSNSENNLFEYFKQTVAVYEKRTPEELANAWNANMVDFCYRTKDLKKISRNKDYPEFMREKAGNMYFTVLEDWRVFKTILNNRVSGVNTGQTVEDLIKKKSQ